MAFAIKVIILILKLLVVFIGYINKILDEFEFFFVGLDLLFHGGVLFRDLIIFITFLFKLIA